jgi:hypothetical protein
VDETVIDRGCRFQLDGGVDESAFWVTSVEGLELFAAIAGRYLYVAATDTTNADRFIFLSRTNSNSWQGLGPGWDKSGRVMTCDAFMGSQGTTLSNGWFTRAGLAFGNLRVARSVSRLSKDGVLEGVIDLEAVFGSIPPVIYLAAGSYGLGSEGELMPAKQCPAGNGNGDIEPSEFAVVDTSSIRVADGSQSRLALTKSATGTTICVAGSAGAVYALETSADMIRWRLLRSLATGAQGTAEYLDSGSATNRFYRARCVWP